ncbi:MAG: hypothetical protein JRJ10_11600 [Deltaproteobacteria bacterium]|nr:hypothetical protein [Deltaproteobacteria bacterium]
MRTSPQPQRPPEPIPSEGVLGGEGDAYEPVQDPNAAIHVPRTSCHDKEIRRVVVVGARRVDPDDVRATMKLRRGSTCTDPAVTRDARALWNMGYFDDLQIESDPIGAGIKLTIRLVERPAIRKVIYEGNDEVDEDDIGETITLEPGTILSVPDVEAQADSMRQLYSEEGFFLADVEYELRRVPGDQPGRHRLQDRRGRGGLGPAHQFRRQPGAPRCGVAENHADERDRNVLVLERPEQVQPLGVRRRPDSGSGLVLR